MERTLTYRYEIVDNVTQVANAGTDAQGRLNASMETGISLQNTNTLAWLKQMTALSSLRRGLSGITMGLVEFGIIGKQGEAVMRKLTAGVSLFVGTAQLIKGVVAIINMLRAAEVGLAAVETYRAVLKNPAMLAVTVAGVGAAAGIGGYLAGKNSGGGGGTTVNQNLTFVGGDASAARGMARESLEVMGGY